LRALAVAVLLVLAAAAPSSTAWAVAVDWIAGPGAGGKLVLAGGETLHATGRTVHDLRTIEPLGTGLELVLWDEEDVLGGRTPHYAVLDGGVLRGRVRATRYDIELADRRFDPLTDGEPLLEPALSARPDGRLFLVQLVATPLPELQERIRAAGGAIHRYLTRHAMVVELDAAARAGVAALPFVRWIGPYHPAYRIEPELRPLAADPGAFAAAAPERYSILLLERGIDRQRALGAAIEALGGRVEVTTGGGFRMEATLTAAQLAALIHDDRVQYVDRWGGPGGTDMEHVRETGGANYLEAETGYTGQGVAGEIFDTELRVTHQEWPVAPLVHSTGTSGGAHGTSVTSNVFARGINAAARGMLPDGQPIFFRYSESSQFGGPIDRYDVHADLIDPLGPYRAVFQTSSVGSTQIPSYTTISAETDDILFTHQLLCTQSQSNTGNQSSRPQAWAKNIVSVGGIRHFSTLDRADDSWTGGASIGPSADGRIKPDLSFFYHQIFSASNGSDVSYTTGFGGTSSATPQTAGHFGLLHQMWHEGVWTGHGGGATVFDSRPHMATAKALMINAAYRYDWHTAGANADLDRFKQGWGTPDLRDLLDNADATTIVDESVVLAPLASHSQPVVVPAGAEALRATLVYVDPAGTVGAGVHRINDLSLRLTSPAAVVYWGNNGLAADNFSTAGGVSNEIDTVENVFVPTPEAGSWTVEVLADEVVADSHVETPAVDADFAIVVSVVQSALFADGFESGDTSAWSAAEP
jgi:hypothetical protein